MSGHEDWTSPVVNSLDRLTFVEGRFDEIVGSAGAHLERMGKNNWFLLVRHDDGSETAIWFKSKDLKKPFLERRERAAGIEVPEVGR